MLKLSRQGLYETGEWERAGISLPRFDLDSSARATECAPVWVHFGAGNIFRGFISELQQRLLDRGRAVTGIVAAETYDEEIIDRIYIPYDNLSLLVIMKPDGNFGKKVVAGVAKSLVGDPSRKDDWEQLKTVFTCKSLQMVSFTVTEKGYNLTSMSGEFLPEVKNDLEKGPGDPRHLISKVAALVYTRFCAGAFPIALVSMDNCAHNGEKLEDAVLTFARKWAEEGLVENEFIDYLSNPEKVSFPWTMIDKITPRPSKIVRDNLVKAGLKDMDIICTAKETYIAPFVNAEGPQYLVVEDNFPNGRPLLEEAGVLFADRETVEKAERMKVTACLNPLHTALAVFGCLLGYQSIAIEMRDPSLKKLVEKIGYDEGMPVVASPGILKPKEFIRQVIEERFPNLYIPDTPQRIATDTSQKMAIRFGETIKAYETKIEGGAVVLKFIPLVIAAWCRYLLGLDDEGNEMQLSPDPMLKELRETLSAVRLGNPVSAKGSLRTVLSNVRLFGTDLYAAGIGEQIEAYFNELIDGKHAVRNTLEKYLSV
jgi:fructuronate reductase